MKPYEILLLNENKLWAAKKLAEDPEFFDRLCICRHLNFYG